MKGYRRVIENSKNITQCRYTWGNSQHMMPKQEKLLLAFSKIINLAIYSCLDLENFVEVLKDVSFRIVPIEREAYEMISEIRSHQMLCGVRGEKPSDIDALVDIMLKVSKFVSDFPEVKSLI